MAFVPRRYLRNPFVLRRYREKLSSFFVDIDRSFHHSLICVALSSFANTAKRFCPLSILRSVDSGLKARIRLDWRVSFFVDTAELAFVLCRHREAFFFRGYCNKFSSFVDLAKRRLWFEGAHVRLS